MFGGIIIKIKNMLIFSSILLILLLATGVTFASGDNDQMQANNNITDESEIISLSDDDLIDEKVTDEEVLSSSNEDVLKESNELYVSPSGGGDGSTQSNPTTWSNAYNNIASGGTIFLLNGTYTNIINVKITKPISLKGIGDVVLDGTGKKGTFITIDNTHDIKMDNIKFINGKNTDGGEYAALVISGSGDNIGNMIFSNLLFRDNDYSGSDGGAIDINLLEGHTYHNFTFENCTFKNNKASYGGAMCIQYNVKNVALIGCVFSGNSAKNEASTLWLGDNSDMIMKKCTFVSTSSSISAIFVKRNSEIKSIEDSTFVNCSSTANGALITYAGTNEKPGNLNSLNIRNITVENIQTSECGAFYFNYAVNNLTIQDSKFINVKSTKNSGAGGVIYFKGAVTNLKFDGVNFTDVGTTGSSSKGGAVYSDGTFSHVSFSNVSFTDVKATSSSSKGGAVYVNGAVTDLNITDSSFNDCDAKSDGGVFYFASTVTGLNMINGSFNDCDADGNGGVFYFASTVTGLNVINSSFNNCDATDFGGVSDFASTAKNIKFENVSFINNSAGSRGIVYVAGVFKNTFYTQHSSRWCFLFSIFRFSM